MKRLLLGALFALIFTVSNGQNLPDVDAISLDKKEDFNGAANDAALEAARYLFNTPVDKEDRNRLRALQYIIRWMTGTPDYNFTLDESTSKLTKKNDELLGLYMAAMVKYVLENKADSKDQGKIRLNAIRQIITYAREEKNKVKLNAELKRMMEAEEKGQLAEYLKI